MNTNLVGSRLKPRRVPLRAKGGESVITTLDAIVVVDAIEMEKNLDLIVRKDAPNDKDKYAGYFDSVDFMPA